MCPGIEIAATCVEPRASLLENGPEILSMHEFAVSVNDLARLLPASVQLSKYDRPFRQPIGIKTALYEIAVTRT